MTAPRRVLAVKLADFGDALLATPALRAMREAWPATQVDVLTTPGPAATVFRHSGLVDDVLTLHKHAFDRPAQLAVRLGGLPPLAADLRSRRYDMVLLFHSLVTRFGALKHAALVLATGAPIRAGLAGAHRRRSWFLTHRAADRGYAGWHVVEANLAVAAAVGVVAGTPSLSFQPGPAAAAAAEQLLAGVLAEGRPLVAVHPGCGPFSPARRWPPDRFAAVADVLGALGARIVLLGTGADDTAAVRVRCTGPVLDLTDRTDLPTLGAVLARTSLLLCNDGGVMHLAAAVGAPVVAVFGPTSPTAWGPWPPERHRVVELDLSCRPCLYVGHSLGDPRGCPTRDCLAWLGTAPVLAAARATLLAAVADTGAGSC